MSDHKHNLTALVAKTLPAWPPVDRLPGIGITTRVVPKRNVYVVVPDEPSEENRKAHAKACQRAGIEQELHQLGEPLPVEKCDVALVFAAGWLDTNSGLRPGQAPREGHRMLPGEITRFDMREFVANCEASLPEEQRIINPGLQVVK